MTNVSGYDSGEMLAGLREWVEIETPTDNPEAVNRLIAKVEADFAGLGAATRRIAGKNGFGDCLKVRMPWGGDGPGILVLGHLDTVHPIGTLERLPFRVSGDTAYGPGIFDMKGGGFIGFHVLRNFVRRKLASPLPVTYLFNSDEEMSSRVSRDYIMEEAKKSKYVLVLEPTREGDQVVDSRKGTARFRVKVTGRPSHAGSRHADGRSAIKELARQILLIEEMTDYSREVTVNVGVIAGGTRPNVIAEFATAEVDMRVPSRALADEMIPKVLDLKPFDPDCVVEITGGPERPPFEKTPGGQALLETARRLAREQGLELVALTTGGASDANFSSPFCPSLDGLGVVGRGAHTMDEQIQVSSLATRATLLHRLIETLN
ncbi:M20 family metallopeptidase [Shumkonia mesophila]|uniref:M20 family metallopeptidase n=1 Tax=Shumkonia mesophila TaxID=2838854 RepID=UPI002934669E|nr:M20 family metallopeptidase [Shumkonia mesophila]